MNLRLLTSDFSESGLKTRTHANVKASSGALTYDCADSLFCDIYRDKSVTEALPSFFTSIYWR